MNAKHLNRECIESLQDIERTWDRFITELHLTSDADMAPTMVNKLLVYLHDRGFLPGRADVVPMRHSAMPEGKRRLARIN